MKYSKAILCPNCRKETIQYTLNREWTSAGLFVNEVSCNLCGFKYRIYFGSKKDGREIAYTIPK